MNTTPALSSVIGLESIVVFQTRHVIERDLKIVAPNVKVVGSRMLEDGYELVVEGDTNQIADLIYLWNHDVPSLR